MFITHSISEAVYMSTKVLVMSARPGRITHSFDVPFAYPRSHDLRYEPAFAELLSQLEALVEYVNPYDSLNSLPYDLVVKLSAILKEKAVA